MRRRKLVAAVLVAVVVILAGSWFGFSGRQGLSPVGAATPGAEDINELYLLMGGIVAFIFLTVTIPLALIVARYRERGLPREAEGPQIRGNTRLELLWTAIPVGIVLFIAAVALYKVPGIVDPASASGDDDNIDIRVEGRQFYWRYVYPNGAVAIDRLRVPLGEVVDLSVTAPEADVAHSFWAPAVAGKIDAIPGETNELKFRATRAGVFRGVCAELCGIQHAAMKLEIEVLPPAEFERWLAQAAEGDDLGQTLFDGVCTKCHFAAPEYAPNIAGNPLLGDEDALRRVVTEGRGRMPAVARGWTDEELDALLAYARTLAPEQEDDGS